MKVGFKNTQMNTSVNYSSKQSHPIGSGTRLKALEKDTVSFNGISQKLGKMLSQIQNGQVTLLPVINGHASRFGCKDFIPHVETIEKIAQNANNAILKKEFNNLSIKTREEMRKQAS